MKGITEHGPRIDYENGKPQLLIEPTRTNSIDYSEFFGKQGFWNTGSPSNTAHYPGVRLDYGYLAPDGTYGATKVTALNDSNAMLFCGSSVNTGPRSIWARTVSGTGTANLCYFNGSGLGLVTLTEEWKRFKFEGIHDSASGNNFYAIDFRNNATLDEAIIWGAQEESNGPHSNQQVTSYIPNNLKLPNVTRDADDLNDVGTGASSEHYFLNNYNTTLFFDGEFQKTDGNTRFITLFAANDPHENQNPRVLLYTSAADPFGHCTLSGMYTFYTGATPTHAYANSVSKIHRNKRFKAALRLNDTKMSLFVNGVHQHTTDIIKKQDIERLDFSNVHNDQGYKVNDIQIFTSALSDADCEALTDMNE